MQYSTRTIVLKIRLNKNVIMTEKPQVLAINDFDLYYVSPLTGTTTNKKAKTKTIITLQNSTIKF
mgnify:CR=1 FL=1